jgi:hypothetical protein
VLGFDRGGWTVEGWYSFVRSIDNDHGELSSQAPSEYKLATDLSVESIFQSHLASSLRLVSQATFHEIECFVYDKRCTVMGYSGCINAF